MKTITQLEAMFEECIANSATANEKSIRSRDFYDGNQLTAAEKATLADRKQPEVVVNLIKPKIDLMMGMERQQRTQPKAFPRNPEHDEGAANGATDALKYIAESNDFDQARSSVFENAIIEGRGACEVIVEVVKGDPQVKINYIPWDRFFIDPHSRRRDGMDAMYMGVVRWSDYDTLIAEYPDKAAELGSVNSEMNQNLDNKYSDRPLHMWADAARKRIQTVEIWWKDGGVIKRAVIVKGGFLEEEADSPYTDEYGDPIWPYEVCTAFIDREGKAYGVVPQFIDSQREYNSRRSKFLHILNTRQVMGERGAVDDINLARKELARTDGYVEVMPGMKFEVLNNLPLGEAHYQLLNQSRVEIDAVGANASMSGKAPQDMSGRALQARQQGGALELGLVFDERTRFTRYVFRKMWNLVKQFWTGPKWIRVTDDAKNIKFVGLNTPVSLGQMLMDAMQGAPFDPEIENDPRYAQAIQAFQQAVDSRNPGAMRQLMQHPIMQQQVKTKNNVGALDVDIIVSEEIENIDIQSEQFAKLVELANAARANPQGPQIPLEALVEASSLRHKDKILEKMAGDPAKKQQMDQQRQAAMQVEMDAKKAAVEREMAAARKDNAQAKVFEASIPISAATAMKELKSFETGQEITPEPSALEMAQQIHDSRLKHVETHAKAAKAMTEAALNMRELANPVAGDSGASQIVPPTMTGVSMASPAGTGVQED